MKFNWLQCAAELEQKGEPFAIATVIKARAPTSAKPVAKAIITADGKMQGWVGGGCSREVVIENALKCIQTGMGTLIRLSPNPDPTVNHSVKEVQMTCESSGTLEIHIEPVLPTMRLLIFGGSPAAQALCHLASILDYDLAVFAPNATEADFPGATSFSSDFSASSEFSGNRCVAVVATQGEGDEKALVCALAADPEYVALIASRTKASKLFKRLEKKGIPDSALEKVKAPAGLDIKAVTPEEIAVSILAEIVQVIRSKEPEEERIAESESKAKDPVCGMTVNPETADHSLEHDGTTYYFCCGGCRTAFENEPAKFAAAA